MQFVGYSFLHDQDAYTYEYVTLDNSYSDVVLANGIYTALYVSNDTSLTQYNNGMPAWGDNTVMRSDFNDSCNVDESNIDLSQVEAIIIKKRKVGSKTPWKTLVTIPITIYNENISFEYIDYMCRSNCYYEYNIVPVINGEEQVSADNIIRIFSDFSGVYFTNGNEQIGSRFDIDTKYDRATSNISVQTINSQYPTVIKNGHMNYSKGSVTVRFLKLTDDEEYGDLENNYKYRSSIIDFLIENNIIVFKNYDGFMAIISLEDGTISEDFSEMAESLIPKQSFNWIQIGDADNCDDLVKFGLTEG